MWEPGKPSQNENEYFARQDEEWKKKRRAELDAERAAKEQSRLQCPRCEGKLAERSFNEVVIDVCEKCRGVWLDGGEIEMLAHVSKGQLQFLIKSINDE